MKTIEYNCLFCKIKVIRRKRLYKQNFCSNNCKTLFSTKHPKETNCLQCNNKIIRLISNKPKKFCNLSCAAKYNNTHKTKGTRISKLELYLKEELLKLYPDLEILFNNKTTIQSELDIYIPSLKLAFEINGIHHYKPIFGESKLKAIQKNDKLKKAKCKKQNIKLIIINSSKQEHFTEKSSQKYLNKIKKAAWPDFTTSFKTVSNH